MKLHDLLNVMYSPIQIEIIVANINGRDNDLTAFDGAASCVPSSVLRAYGTFDVFGITRPLIHDACNIKFDENGTLHFSFKNAIQIFIGKRP